MLPSRYNQFIIENFFKLIHENDRPYEGIDFQSYIYYDYALRLFYNENSAIRWNLNESEFTQSLSNSKFPNHIYEELKLIPSTNFSSVRKINFIQNVLLYIRILIKCTLT